jgi:hypothetical protein
MIRYKFSLDVDIDGQSDLFKSKTVTDRISEAVNEELMLFNEYLSCSTSFVKELQMSSVPLYPLSFWEALEKCMSEGVRVRGENFPDGAMWAKADDGYIKQFEKVGNNTIIKPVMVTEMLSVQKFQIIKN